MIHPHWLYHTSASDRKQPVRAHHKTTGTSRPTYHSFIAAARYKRPDNDQGSKERTYAPTNQLSGHVQSLLPQSQYIDCCCLVDFRFPLDWQSALLPRQFSPIGDGVISIYLTMVAFIRLSEVCKWVVSGCHDSNTRGVNFTPVTIFGVFVPICDASLFCLVFFLRSVFLLSRNIF